MPGMELSSPEEALAFLQKTSTTSGDSIYQHLTNVIQQVLEEKPVNAVDILETSLLTKRTKFIAPDATRLLPSGDIPKDSSSAISILDLYSTPEPVIDVETGEPEEAEPPNEYETENMLADAPLLEAVGVGLGRVEMYQVMLAMKKLGEDPKRGVATLRFFGKFFGIYNNYFVFEGSLKEPPEEDEEGEGKPPVWGRPVGDVPVEKGEGANVHTYWVCTDLGGGFYQLPDVNPLQIKTARAIKRFLTGNLKAEVSAYPPFPGVEENYLRAQIARIGATTIVCPNGYFKISEEDESGKTLEKNDEYVLPAPADLETLEGWVHREEHLKAQGRCSVWTPPPPEDLEEGEEEPPLTEEQQEEGPAPLTTLDIDADLAVGGKPWAICSSSNVPSLKYRVAAVRSLLWPGAYAIATPNGFSNIYIGWGIKNAPFVPPPPPEVGKEFDGSLVESVELPPKPGEEPPADDEDGEGDEDGEEEDE